MHVHWKGWPFIFLLLIFVVCSRFLIERERNVHAHHDHTDLYYDHSHSEGDAGSLSPTREPDRVILNLTENPEKSIAVNWRTDTTVAAGFAEFAIATAGPEFINS